PGATRAALILIGVELAQGLVGFVQYFTALPVLLVGVHMAGACAVWLAALHLYAHTRTRGGPLA
ncbi:MAG: heme A synthase, partial [Micromonosporaceae bacterium]